MLGVTNSSPKLNVLSKESGVSPVQQKRVISDKCSSLYRVIPMFPRDCPKEFSGAPPIITDLTRHGPIAHDR